MQRLCSLCPHAPPAAGDAAAPRLAGPLALLVRDDLTPLLLLLGLQLREARLLRARLLLSGARVIRGNDVRRGGRKATGGLGRLRLCPRLVKALVREVLADALEAILVLGRRNLRATNRERHRICGFSVVRRNRGRVLLVLLAVSRCDLVHVAVLVVSAAMLQRLCHIRLMIAEDAVLLELLDAAVALIASYCPL